MAPNERVEGYTLLSGYMAKRQNAVFRLFQPLAARDLLFMQAELVHLDNEYQELEKEARASGDTDKHSERYWSDRDWRLLRSSSEQWTKALEIRAKLKNYCKILNQSLVYSRLQSTSRSVFGVVVLFVN